MEGKQRSLISNPNKNVFQAFVGALDEEPQNYLRTIINLNRREIVSVPRKQPLKRLLDFGIIPKSKYTLDVYLEIAKQCHLGRSPDQIVKHLRSEYISLEKARLSRKFVKKAIKLLTRVMMPEMVSLVPKDGNWTMMIDGTIRAKHDNVLIIIAAVPLDSSLGDVSPNIIPLMAKFLPSENTQDILELLYDLKPRLPSQPKSIISDFRPGLIESIGKVFPNVIELITWIMIYPLINKIKKKLRSAINELNRWAYHSIYGRKSDNLLLVARGLQKLITSNHGKFGDDFLQFCKKFQALTAWIEKDAHLLKSSKKYHQLVTFIDLKLWRQLAPQLSQLEFSMREFNRLRKCLTMQKYKTEVMQADKPSSGIIPLDQLLHDWSKLAEINKKLIFHKRFKRSVSTLRRHYHLLIPAILDATLPRTTSHLERLYGQTKQFLRKWSGSMKIRRSFQWAAPLAAFSQSLKETGQFYQIL